LDLDDEEGMPVGNDGPKFWNYYWPIDANDDDDFDSDAGLLLSFVRRTKGRGHLQQWPGATFFDGELKMSVKIRN
jgi:hypothetical protein